MHASRLMMAGGVIVLCGTLYVTATSLLPPSVTTRAENSPSAGAGDGHGRELAALRQDIVRLQAAWAARRHAESDVGTLHGELRHLQQAVGTLHGELRHLQQAVRALQQQGQDSTKRVSEKQAAVIDTARPTRDDPHMRAQAREQWQWEQLQVLETRFQREPRATPWATATAKIITQALARAELQLTHVVDMECRATLCQLELLHADLQAATDFTLLFPMELGEVLPQMHYDQQQLNDGSIRMVIYMGHELSALAEAK